jgi:predicted permease
MNWLQQLVSRRRQYRDLSNEMAEHLQEKIEELMHGGMPRQQAEATARREFGNVLLIEEHGREVWQWAVFDAILRDLKYALRQLRRNPGFTFIVLLILSVAIGANTAVFSMVNALMLRPLPYPEPQQLATVMRNYGITKDSRTVTDSENEQDGETWELVRDNVPAVEAAVYSYGSSGVNLQAGTSVRYVQQQRVSASYFDVLGIRPILGRTFTVDEDRPHGPQAAVLSFELWQSLFAGDRDAVGKAILLKGAPCVIVGVLPANTHTTGPADLWTPLQPSRSGEGGGQNYHIVVRLKPEASWTAASTQMAALRPHSFLGFAKEYPEGHAWLSVRSMQQELADASRRPTLILMSAVAIILLIACANLAGLMLVRVARRTGELATRLALGATHASIWRQLMMEPLLLALTGGTAGVLLASASLRLFSMLLPPEWMPVAGLGIDGRVLCFAVAASICTCLLIGILPAVEIRWLALRPSMARRGSESGAGLGRRRTRQALIAGEVMLTVVLLAGAGLLVRTLVHLQTLPPGFDATNVMSAQVSLDDAGYHDPAAFQTLLERSLEAMKRIPGVESVAVALSLPFERGLNNGFRLVEGVTDDPGHMSSAAYVTPEFFSALRIPVLAGRTFNASDTQQSEPVVMVNTSFALEFFKTTDVVGRHIRSGDTLRRIVGIVGDVTKRPGLFQRAPLSTEVTYYFPATQANKGLLQLIHVWFQPSWIVRSRHPIADLNESMQKAIAEVDPALPIASFHRLSDLQALALRQQRFQVFLLGTLAALALLLSLVGVYGLVSNMVAQRTREIGIRMALGSSVRQAMMEVGTSGIVAVALGLAGGLALSTISVRLIKSELYGVQIYDPLTFAVVLALLILSAIAATFLPTQKIARIDPASTLWAE